MYFTKAELPHIVLLECEESVPYHIPGSKYMPLFLLRKEVVVPLRDELSSI